MFAYVDPGIIGTLYQMAYVAILGLVAAVIFRPWAFIKAKFSMLGGRRRRDAAPASPRDPDRPGDGTR